METSEAFRNIPQVERVIDREDVRAWVPVLGREIVVGVVREEITRYRAGLRENPGLPAGDIYAAVVERCAARSREKLQRVINGTGVILHTNLGRAPLSREVLDRLAAELSGYCNLEYYLPEKKRGKRGGFAEELIAHLTGAQDALIVNNNASSVYLLLRRFGAGREVIVSRGELIQIGGGFRIPDIMRETGARLVEVGTTNITELEDYRAAIGDDTAMLFSAHQSNFRIRGFSSIPSIKELSTLKREGILLVRDLGSGNLVFDDRLPASFEPTVAYEMSQGADLVCFSGDKLLGGCQAGFIVGRADLIAKLRTHPLMRMLRVDKVTYFILQETLIAHMNGEHAKVPAWDAIFQDAHELDRKIARFMKLLKSPAKKTCIRKSPLSSAFGGGSLPTMVLRSEGVRIEIPGMSAESVSDALVALTPPVIGYIDEGVFTLDFRTLFPADIPDLAAGVDSILPRDGA
ncbi:MAG: L-seryl-tRNA(Sec) selenium transferase [Spirochaetes bacterium]|nr:MAG: L-seryl-tRNA(Sec) selenium transferase [Spirochaetota bacterium]